jgi:hypothetical protein
LTFSHPRCPGANTAMRNPLRRLPVLAAIILALTILTSCGNTSDPQGATVAEVDGETISKATLEHWTHIEAIIANENLPQTPPQPGRVPDPPHYTACITYLKTIQAPAKPTSTQLKTQCQEHYLAVRNHMLQILISYIWVKTEDNKLHIHTTPQEIQQTFNRFKHEQYPTETIYQNYLKATTATPTDELWIEQFDMLSGKLGHKLIKQGQPATTKFYTQFPTHWKTKTNCNPQYIIPECKQYKGPKPPEPSI